MKQKNTRFQPVIGGISLLVIFGVLCLVIFSLLALNTALAEQRLSETAARQTVQWYAADLQAQEIFAKIRSGEPVSGLEETETGYQYRVPVSEYQSLLVTVKETNDGWEILSWQTQAHPQDGDTSLPVWQGP